MSEIKVDPTLYKGRPENSEGRLPKEIQVYDVLDKLKIPYERADHEEAATIEACEAVERVLGTTICKNLVLRNQQKNTFFLLLLPGDKQFSTKDFSKRLGVSRVSFAEPEYLEKYLNVTPGSVSILGLIFDKDWDIELVIDQDLLKEEYIGCHPCINTSTLKLRMDDLLKKFLKHTKHHYNTVKL